tara:strand:- start:127672 stop:130725 length:3054 start_codon:yes stop_codon:yes gene_type:complete
MPAPQFESKEAEVAYRKAEQRIAEAAREKEAILALSGLGLTSVPPEIGQLTSLTVLYLHDNQLTSVPPEIGQLVSLASLRLDSNKLTSVPPEIGQLTSLTTLRLDHNQLTSLPPKIGQLASLTMLHFQYNQLTSVPAEIGQLASLTTLFLDNNQLTSVPAEIGQLTSLTTLSLYNNQLTSVPPAIGQLTSLTALRLDSNKLTSVPVEIGQLASVAMLSLDNNQLTSVPLEIGQLTSLTTLYLDDNQLQTLPEELRRLSKLKVLFLHGNPRLKLPASLLGVEYGDWDRKVETAPKAGPILDYYFGTVLANERRPLNEAKLILVGRGEAGKTSLVKRLVENRFSRREDTTQGIRIQQWPITVGRKKDEVRLNVWDFGGQEIMHATHQFFLTDRSLYLLVLDGRAGQQEAEADYWLRLISGFAPESPVLVVLNKIKKDHFTLNRDALRQKYPQIQDFIETDCDNPGSNKKPGQNGHGIDKLRKAIAKHVNKLPDVRMAFPKSWFAVKEKLSKSQTSRRTSASRQKNFLTLDEFRDECEELGETDPGKQESLSAILHRLGIALNFSDDRRLNDRHVLNPHWLTTGIYTLLNSKTLASRKGELRPKDLTKELDVRHYPADMHPFLIHLMEKFELCFGFNDASETGKSRRKSKSKGAEQLLDRYLIPELLDPEQPSAARSFDEQKCLNFQYDYPVLPPGLLPRFIVRTHVLSETHRWKTGVILSFEGNTALVKADPQEQIIRVLINGPAAGRPRMLAVIREDFDVIHRDIPHMKPQELISFPDHPSITVPYQEIEVLYDASPETPVVRVKDGEVVSHTAGELLLGVEFGMTAETGRRRAVRPGVRKSDRQSRQPDAFVALSGDQPLRVFYSYSRLDAKQRLKLAKHLSPLERIGLIHTWHDNEILPGAEFNPEIAEKLNESDIILLLISPNFTASDYCMTIELSRAMRRHQSGADNVAVLPVIVSPTTGWKKQKAEGVKLGDLNALPEAGKEIPKWKPQDNGWANVAAGVERAAEALRKKRGL